MEKLRETHVREGDLSFAFETIDMLDLRLKQLEGFVDLAKIQTQQIQWREYEESFDEKVRRFL